MAWAATSTGERDATAEGIDALWLEFVSDRSPRLREQLILRYAWLVKHVLSRLALVLPPSLDYGDLLGHGTIALVEAIDRFEPERGNKFETYAALRIKGAILDAVRAMDFVSRPVRRMKQVAEAVAGLTRDLGDTVRLRGGSGTVHAAASTLSPLPTRRRDPGLARRGAGSRWRVRTRWRCMRSSQTRTR